MMQCHLGMRPLPDRTHINMLKLQIDLESLLTGDVEHLAQEESAFSEPVNRDPATCIVTDMRSLRMSAPGFQLILEGLHFEVRINNANVCSHLESAVLI